MKIKIIEHWYLTAAILTLTPFTIFGQNGFQDLDFESPVLPLVPVVGSSPYVYSSNAMPGWTIFLGATTQNQVLFNAESTGAAAVALLGPGQTVGFTIAGNYTPVLQAGDGSNFTPLSASIAQSGFIPLTAKSLLIKEFSGPNSALVTVGGQNVPMFALSSGANYTLFGGDISSFAGLTEQLQITSPDAPYSFNTVHIDDIQFSPTPVPEPGTWALMICGGILFGVQRLRKA